MKTSENAATILVGEDEIEVLGYFETALKCLGYGVEAAQDGDEVLSRLRSSRSDIAAVLLDVFMPNRGGIETLHEIRNLDPSMPVIVVSGVASPQNIVNVIKSGAADFLCKPVSHEDLGRAIHSALEIRSSAHHRSLVGSHNTVSHAFAGTCPSMREIQRLIVQIGWSEVPVLIQGETGTGKEVLARELHARSPRADKPFLKLNCAALPSELVESELFGYERGAFTGAIQRKPGMFEMADGGTILLDEIGDMDLRLQAKLLQVLQDQEFRRIGGKETVKVDVRVMAATHRDLQKAILEQSFREDLYYRLSVFNLLVPPLRDRVEDIVPLAELFIKKYAIKDLPLPTIGVELRHALLTYQWPGNVRELENWIRKLTILRDGNTIARELQAKANSKLPPASQIAEERTEPLPMIERSPILEQVSKAKAQAETTAILAALESTHWNRKRAAGLLKIDYKALLYKMKKLGIDSEPELKPVTSDPDLWKAANVNGN